MRVSVHNVLLSFSDAIDLASPEISSHQMRTAYVALTIAGALGIRASSLRTLFKAALFHDVGAIDVSEKVRLRNFEEREVRTHCAKGALVMRLVPFFSDAAPVVARHHERWDEWVPDESDEVALMAQILTLADFVERWTDRDEYALKQADAIRANAISLSGSVIRPDVVEAFIGASRSEWFWLELVSSRLYSSLFKLGPFGGESLELDAFESISIFVKNLIDLKSPFTASHSSGVSAVASELARGMGLGDTVAREIAIAGNLHDLGKLGIPTALLDKPGPLDRDELLAMKAHPFSTTSVLQSIRGLDRIESWAGSHHETPMGTGYPARIGGDRLSMEARIVSVADNFAALSEDRPYRRGMRRNEIVAALADKAARGDLDADAVRALLDDYATIDRVREDAQRRAMDFYARSFVGA